MSSSIFPSESEGDHLSFLDDILNDFPPQDPFFLSSPNTKSSSSGSGSGSGSDDWEVNLMNDERRQRRKVSNRESARRSRLRKQRHLENLRNKANRYETTNQELMNRLRFVNHNGQLVRRQNQRLRSESMMLQQRLCYLHQALLNHHPLLASAWPCNNNVNVDAISINEQNLQSLITF